MIDTIVKIIHIVSVIAWMVGMLYLPRLFVYHVGAVKVVADTLAIMERRLLRIIINPAMIIAIISGIYLMVVGGFYADGWMHAKLALVIIMTALHGLLARHRQQLANNSCKRSARYFRILNEIPTLLLIAIVALVIAKPF